MVAIRLFCFLFLCFLFYIGFFENTSIYSISFYIKDTYVHLIVFFIYTVAFYLLLPKFRFKLMSITFLFSLMAYLVEIFQSYLSYRSYSIIDFKASLYGTLSSSVLIVYSTYLSKAIKAKE